MADIINEQTITETVEKQAKKSKPMTMPVDGGDAAPAVPGSDKV